MGKIRASIERDRYRLHKDVRTGGYQAPNHAHDLHATFTREGFEVNPRKGEKGWNWGLSLSRYGYGSDLRARMTADQEGIRLIVADHEAAYPITIDPFIERKKLLAGYGAAGDWFGGSVSISGDTAIVGADHDDDNGDNSGSAYVWQVINVMPWIPLLLFDN